MKTILTKGNEIYVSVWERYDICNILNSVIEDYDFDINQDQFDEIINKTFIWMDSLDDCNNPPTFDSILSHIENTYF